MFNCLKPLNEIPPNYSFLSKGSKVLDYKSIYPIFLLKHKDKKGSLIELEKAVTKLDPNHSDITEKDVEIFLNKHPEIEFELDIFGDMLNEPFYFRIKDEIYCYALKEASKSYVMIRFFFDIKKFIE